MIVKILKSAANFAGVNYNERKNENGKSELLCAANFEFAGEISVNKQTYINYMEKVGELNGNVKNKQFHAVISCAGREYSPEQLKDVAELYLHKMGYGANPYLIYFHSDTQNNHVHIVSTRVDKEGRKVNDSLERVRSQKILSEIMNLDLNDKAQKDYKQTMNYSFSTMQQFKMILESRGWKVREKGNVIDIVKAGAVCLQVKSDDVLQKIERQKVDSDRKKQVVALLHKYKSGLSHTELANLMKKKFGVELIFHTSKNHKLPYGYTVIDNNGKCVYKGSELLSLKEILISPEKQQKIDNSVLIAESVLRGEKHTLESFKENMKQYGYTVSYQGKIGLKGNKDALFTLDEKVLKELRYKSRLLEANKFSFRSEKEAKVLAKLYFVKAGDINIDPNRQQTKDISTYSQIMESYINNGVQFQDKVNDNGYAFIKDKNELYLVDKNNQVIIGSTDLGLSYLLDDDRGVGVTVLDSSRFEDVDIEQSPDAARGYDMIDAICDILNQNMNVKADKKRKKSKGQQH